MTSRPSAAVAATLGLLAAAPAQRRITTPREAFGKQVGADHFLASYTQLRTYWGTLARESDRMVLEEIGRTSYGQPMLMAVISSPDNLRHREELRRIVNRLCRARGLTDGEARALAAKGRAVVWIDAGMHATECVAAQNILELVYRMNARTDAETREILDNVILLVCPANPDGMEMIADAYMATRRVGGLPVLYQRWVGHDNNRDFYACNQAETTAINRVFYDRWNPQIVYNHHQTAPRGTIIFTPPFRDPFNYNVDPRVVRGIEVVAAHMNDRFALEGKPGVISRTGAPYSTWWNGGLRTTTYFHNMIGILTESFGKPAPTRITQTLSRRLPHGDYPDPVGSQIWHARQTIEYLQTANSAILEYAARYRRELLWNFYQMGRDAIRNGSRDHWTVTPEILAIAKERKDDSAFTDPDLRDARGYVIPSDQSDFSAATHFVDQLLECGVEVQRARRDFDVGFARYPAGSFVVQCAQAFRAHVRDMFEPQWHPQDLGSGGEPVRPYDSAGWTLAMQMGVQFDRIRDGFDGPFEPVRGLGRIRPGKVTAGRAGWVATHYDSHSYKAANRLLAAGDRVYWLEKRVRLGGRAWPAGTVFVRRGPRTAGRIARLARDLGLSFHGVDRAPPGPALALERPRIGLFDVWGGNISTGWTQWVLEQFEFPVELVFGKRIVAGKLRKDYDVLIFHTGLPRPSKRPRGRRPRRVGPADVAKLQKALPPFEDWSRIADRLVGLTPANCAEHLKEFVRDGGTLLGLGTEAGPLIRMFDLAVRTGTRVEVDGKPRPTNRSEFFIPGSLVRIDVDPTTVVGYGVPRHTVAMFRRSPVFEVDGGGSGTRARAPVRYASEDTLASGWAIGVKRLHGRAAVLTASSGNGRVFVYGPDVLYRGQPWTTFKLVFNAILGGPAERVQSTGD